MGDTLKQKMISAVVWSTVEKSGQQVIQFLAGIVLARLLVPEDFGVMGIIMIFVALSMILVESGFGQALIRRINVSETDYSSVFYFNLITAAVIYLILFLIAPFIAAFFHQSQLTLLIRVMSLVVIVNAFYLIPYAQLGRALDFKTISRVNVISVSTGAVAGIVTAFLHFGVWSLVVQQSVYHVVKMFLLYITVGWKPSGIFDFGIIRSLWSYSLKILFTSIVNILFNNLFLIILGRSYSKAEAGQFAQGNKLSETFSYTFQSIFAGSTFALFSRLQDDIPRLGRILGEMIRRTALVTIPVVAVLIAAAPSLIPLLWTEKFLPAVMYFQLMSMASVLAPFYIMNINALNARGKSGKTMAIELIKKAIIVTGILLLYRWGIVYMLIAFVAGSLLAYPVSVWFVKKELNRSVRKQTADLLPGLITGVVLGLTAATFNLLHLNIWLTLLLQLTVASLLYLGIIGLFFRELFDKFITFVAKHISFFKKTTA
jgi:O-antigen/teichoic acid export membrane protein